MKLKPAGLITGRFFYAGNSYFYCVIYQFGSSENALHYEIKPKTKRQTDSRGADYNRKYRFDRSNMDINRFKKSCKMNPIEKYFEAEKAESLLFILIGLAGILLAGYFLLKLKLPFYKGMAWPFIAIALIQLVVGTSVYFRSAKDIERVNTMLKTDSMKIQTEEIPRMETVMRNFVVYRWIEIGLILAGLLLFFSSSPATFLRGLGLGLAIQSGFMLLLDFFAESRGIVYLQYLQHIIPASDQILL